MFLTKTEYDRGINTFSPEGRLFQVEYAMEAVKMGSTVIGVQTKEGAILVVEKRVTSTLIEADTIEKVYEIDRHIGCAMSGLSADSGTLINHARNESASHWFTYNEKIRVESVTQSVCDLALRFGEGMDGSEAIMSRPFGVSLLIIGVDEAGPHLYYTDPSGTFFRYEAKAVGSGSEGAQTVLEEEYHKGMTLIEAKKLALKVLKEVMEEKVNSSNIEIATVTPQDGYKLMTKAEIEAELLSAAVA